MQSFQVMISIDKYELFYENVLCSKILLRQRVPSNFVGSTLNLQKQEGGRGNANGKCVLVPKISNMF